MSAQRIELGGGRRYVLLLDEPTSRLDPLMEREFRRCVLEAKAGGQTVFLSSHIAYSGTTLRWLRWASPLGETGLASTSGV
jgi:ABC-type transport system involved in cytochrome bd biosynthesis fused ATPase/permease subunit